jgi:hypothetical protein
LLDIFAVDSPVPAIAPGNLGQAYFHGSCMTVANLDASGKYFVCH